MIDGNTIHQGDAVTGVHHSDGVLLVEQHLPAGHEATSDVHTYPHLSVLAQGSCVLHVEGQDPQELHAPAITEVAAGLEHHLYAVTDVIWYCIHATDGSVGPELEDFLDEYDIGYSAVLSK